MNGCIYEVLYLATSPVPLSIPLLFPLQVQALATLSKDICLGMMRKLRKETLDKVTQLEKLVLLSHFSLFCHSLEDKLRQVKISKFM